MSPKNFKDLTGLTFNDWTVIKKAESKKERTYWLCRCSCGVEKEVNASSLKRGISKSCGTCQNSLQLIGQTFYRLTVISKAESDKSGASQWNCKCICGNDCVVRGSTLKGGRVRSCGCLNLENITKHGMSSSREYHIWEGMIQRCENPNDPSYKHYGDRGIVVSKEWHDFETFFNDIGKIPIGFEIDRIDNNKDYCTSNCKTSTRKEQMQNMSKSKTWAIHGNTFKSLRDAAKSIGISSSQILRNCNGYTHSETNNWIPPKTGWNSELKYKEVVDD